MKKIENIDKYIKIILSCISIISIIWACFTFYNGLIHNFKLLEEDIKKLEQRSLKNLIWNNEIPLNERMVACDEYIKERFNSFTQKHCEELLKGVE